MGCITLSKPVEKSCITKRRSFSQSEFMLLFGILIDAARSNRLGHACPFFVVLEQRRSTAGYYSCTAGRKAQYTSHHQAQCIALPPDRYKTPHLDLCRAPHQGQCKDHLLGLCRARLQDPYTFRLRDRCTSHRLARCRLHHQVRYKGLRQVPYIYHLQVQCIYHVATLIFLLCRTNDSIISGELLDLWTAGFDQFAVSRQIPLSSFKYSIIRIKPLAWILQSFILHFPYIMSKFNYSGIQETEFRSRNKGTGKAV